MCTVTVPKTARIAEYSRRLDASVRRAGFAPLRLDLAHEVGVAASTFPLGVSLTRQGSVTRHATRNPAGRFGRHRRHGGRGVTRPLADFGHNLPTTPSPAAETRQARLFHYASSRGHRRADRGWAAAKAPVSTGRMTSDQAPVLWPFIATPGLPPTGAQMGIDMLSGGSFYADPLGWVLNDMVPVTNPNMFIFGKPGRGKSATVKALLLRMMDFGYRALILGDPKDEYEKLCRALGVEPFTIGPGLPARINPLAFGPLGAGWNHLSTAEAQSRAAIVFGRWPTLVRGLVGSQRLGDQRVPFGPTDEVVIKACLQELTGYTRAHIRMRDVTIPQLWHLLDNPTAELISECRYQSARQFLDETRLLRDALGQLVSGALAGLFDGPTTIEVDWRAPIQSLSLSRLEPLGDEAVGIALLCLNTWGRGMREVADRGDVRIVVRDESWKQLRLGVEAVKSFDSDLRLSRSSGDIQIAVGHKPSDPLSAGDASSQAVAIAKDLLHLADIKVLHGQDVAVAQELDGLLGLGPIAQNLVTICIALASFAVCSGWVILSTGVLERWMGWGIVVAGLCLAVARFAWTAGFWGVGYALFWLWIIVVCIRLIVRPDRWSNAAR